MDPETAGGFGNSYSNSPGDSVWIQKQQVGLETATVTARVTQYRSRNSSYSDSPGDSVWIQKQQTGLETATVTARVTQYGSRNNRRDSGFKSNLSNVVLQDLLSKSDRVDSDLRCLRKSPKSKVECIDYIQPTICASIDPDPVIQRTSLFGQPLPVSVATTVIEIASFEAGTTVDLQEASSKLTSALISNPARVTNFFNFNLSRADLTLGYLTMDPATVQEL
ncbi:hypothetical protein RRG08_024817 [Elysia crispata]|uniref:Uncharacterized protein n=1 Tax=Elysia crispata TaxID=231223 RepID=A0AAE0YJA3_9GAST|nr:hypothetical protein RRG08_024817 [Elysia crispata]